MNRRTVLLVLFVAACAGGGTTVQTGTGAIPAPVGPAPVVYNPVQSPRIPGAVWPDEGPRTWAPRPTEAAISANDLRTRLYQISDDSMMGRQAASLGNVKATDYVAAEFRKLGLTPAGENGTFFQELQLGLHRFDSTKVQLSVNGEPMRAKAQWVPLSPSTTVSGDFQAQNAQVVFAGRWGDTATVLNSNTFRGKIALFLAPTPAPAGAGGGRGAGGRGGAGGGLSDDPRARNVGALAHFVISDSITDMMSSAAFNSRNLLIPFTTTTTAGARISAAAAASFFNQPISQLSIGSAGRNVSATWKYEYTRPPYPARNVIAILRGSDPALRGQYVLVGAHNDHVGMVPPAARRDHDSLRAYNRVMRPQGANDPAGQPNADQQRRIDSLIRYARSIRPPRIDSVMNGADDDGSGTALLLEIAEHFASTTPPKRSIIFISHAAEESGLLGSRYWTDRITVPRDSIVAAHNMDMVGNGGVADVKFGGPAQVQMLGARRLSSEFGDIIDSLNAVRSEVMAIDYSWDRTNALNRFCRSDQVNYFRFAIPVTYFSTGYSPDYHQATDEPQYIDYDHSARVGRFVHEIMMTVANRPRRLAVLPLEQRDLSARC